MANLGQRAPREEWETGKVKRLSGRKGLTGKWQRWNDRVSVQGAGKSVWVRGTGSWRWVLRDKSRQLGKGQVPRERCAGNEIFPLDSVASWEPLNFVSRVKL